MSIVKRVKNPEIAAHFEALSAHSDVASELLSALAKLGEFEVHSGSHSCAAVYCVTKEIVFCAASGTSQTFWRLRPQDAVIALATGAEPADLGPEWVKITLFRADWPRPDLPHWALRAYDYARTGI